MTVLGRTARLRGDLECDGDLQIDGEFEGSVRQNDGRVIVGEHGHVQAHIIAEDVIVMGIVDGDIRATGRVELRSTAVVTGDIFAGRLSMEENAVLRGQVDPTRSGERSVPYAESPVHQMMEPPAPPPSREPEHRQAVPLREDSSSRYRTQPIAVEVNGRPLPSALAAFAPGGRRGLVESGVPVARPHNETLWQNIDTE